MTFLKRLYTTIFHTYTLRDTSKYEHQPTINQSIYGAYHVFCDTGWQDLVSAQMEHLRASGLLSATKSLYVSCVYRDEKDIEDIKKIVNSDKLQIISATRDASVYEYPALICIQEKCQTEDCLFYYFHTKGVSFSINKSKNKHYLNFMRNVTAWRMMMEHFVMDKWKVAVNALCDGYDTYGSYRWPPRPDTYKMYSGNFWWSKSSYIRSLPTLNTPEIRHNRLYAELWIYTGKGKDYCPFDTLAVLYHVYLPPSLYEENNPSLAARLSFAYHFNAMKIGKKVFKYNYDKHGQLKYQNKK